MTNLGNRLFKSWKNSTVMNHKPVLNYHFPGTERQSLDMLLWGAAVTLIGEVEVRSKNLQLGSLSFSQGHFRSYKIACLFYLKILRDMNEDGPIVFSWSRRID